MYQNFFQTNSIIELICVRRANTLRVLRSSWFIYLITILDNVLFYRRYIDGCPLIIGRLTTHSGSRITARAALSCTYRCWSNLWMISVVHQNHLIANSKHLLVLFIRKEGDLFSILSEWAFWLWYLLSCHFVRWSKWILMTLTCCHELLEYLWWTTRCFFHEQRILDFFTTSTWEIVFSSAIIIISLVSSKISQLRLHKHFILNILILVQNLVTSAYAR